MRNKKYFLGISYFFLTQVDKLLNAPRILMHELKKMEKYLRVNLLRPGPRLMKKEYTGSRSDKG